MRNYNGESWGVDRYRIFSQSKIVITKHISSVAGEYCNNMTLYEGTGCGALLLTDYKNNLHDLFATEEEVIAYKSPEEAIQKIKYYLAHEAERKSIADAGQKRTLSEHSYYNRMKNLLDIVDAHVGV
jgi:spore maturation protein CgeB